MSELTLPKDLELQNIKVNNISKKELRVAKDELGSFEALFSRRALKFRQQGLHEKNLTEQDYEQLILDEYTFLKRPVVLYDDKVFVGNSKKNVEALKAYFN